MKLVSIPYFFSHSQYEMPASFIASHLRICRKNQNIGATFYSSSFEQIGSVMMSSINKIVSNKQNAKEQCSKNMIKGL